MRSIPDAPGKCVLEFYGKTGTLRKKFNPQSTLPAHRMRLDEGWLSAALTAAVGGGRGGDGRRMLQLSHTTKGTFTLLAQSADALRVSASELSGLNAQAVAECYAELLGLRSADVLAALMRAVESLLCKLHVALVAQPSFVRQGAAVRPFAVLMLNPLLLEPQYHKQVLLPLLSLVAALPPPCCTQLVRWWSLLPAALLQQMVAVCQQFITVRLYYTQRIDDAVVAVRRLLLRPVHPIKTTVRQCGRAHRSARAHLLKLE